MAEMMAYFPARDVEEPVTKEFVRAEAADLRADMAERIHRSTVWTVGAVTACSGVLLTAKAVLR